MATYPVKYITNTMRGAGVVSGTPGSRVAVLDDLLINGWGQAAATGVAVSAGIATATFAAGISFDLGTVILVAGATGVYTGLNGEARVLSAGSNWVTFATAAPDGAATGSITAKYAPVGSWEHAFAPAGHKRAYRSTHPQSHGHIFRVDDAATMALRLVGYESMTDIDAGVGACPTDAQVPGGAYVLGSIQANATANRYRVLADGLTVLVAFAVNSGASPTAVVAPLRGFGYAVRLSPGGDPHAAFVSGAASASGGVALSGALDYGNDGATGGTWLFRSDSGIGGAVQMANYTYVGGSGVSGADPTLGAFPSRIDGKGKPSRRFLAPSATDRTPRGDIPGLCHLPQSGVLAAGIVDGDLIDGAGDLAGRKLLAVASGGAVTSNPAGVYLVDTTGPWR